MKLAEIKALTTPELQERVVAEEAAYNKKCIDHAVTPADNPAEIRRMRRTIAQMKTILRERELNNNYCVLPMEQRRLRKERVGVVSSNKMDKTITVAVKWKEKHPIYGKFVNKTKKYHAHDEKNECNIGDTVRIMETRPLSRTKRWRLVNIIERAK